MEGMRGTVWAGGVQHPHSLPAPPQEMWAFLEELLNFFETYITWAKSSVSEPNPARHGDGWQGWGTPA